VQRKREGNRAWREKNREALIAKRRAWVAEHADLLSDRNYRYKFGIGKGDVAELLSAQGDVCAICRAPIVLSGRRGAQVDHDHSTNVIRGVLCSPCNLALGHMKDSPDRLRAAADYLERAPQ
jgi:hypothetical protein